MTVTVPESSDLFDYVQDFVGVTQFGEVTLAQLTEFEHLLRENKEARHLYTELIKMSVHLPRVLTGIGIGNDDGHQGVATGGDGNSVQHSSFNGQPSLSSSSPIPTFLLSPTLPGTIGFFSSDWPVAYLIATVICGVSMLIGSLIPTSQPAQVARQSSTATNDKAAPEPKMELVGRITGMVDCKWDGSGAENQKSEIRNQKSLVALGDKFALVSGLMEITYDTGAKVILQGPVKYEVESATGGYLAVGKLTGKVEKKVASGQWPVAGKHEIPNPQSLIPNPPLSTNHYPLFTIRTPTAIVTDLGTEFGVEVREAGTTTTHVFRGVVEVRQVAERGQPGQPIRLAENESVRVEKQRSDEGLKIQRGMADSARFVRSEQLAKLIHSRQSKHVHTPPLLWPITNKTLVAWVSLDNTKQQGVGILSLANMPLWNGWDGIVFGELSPGKWMAGSHDYLRTQRKQAAYSVETAKPNEFVQIAIVYDGTWITIYRNGQQYANYDAGSEQGFDKDSIILMGKRFIVPTPTLAGQIEEARLYNVVLLPTAIAALRPNEPSPIGPVGQWTFEDGTARDSTGHFPMGQLHGNAKIAGGRLILDGADSYLTVPPALPAERRN